jgi:hypothetical protein
VFVVCCANAGASDANGAERKASAPTAKARTPNIDRRSDTFIVCLVYVETNNSCE